MSSAKVQFLPRVSSAGVSSAEGVQIMNIIKCNIFSDIKNVVQDSRLKIIVMNFIILFDYSLSLEEAMFEQFLYCTELVICVRSPQTKPPHVH